MQDCETLCSTDQFCDRAVVLCFDCVTVCQPQYPDRDKCPLECQQNSTIPSDDGPTSSSPDYLKITITVAVITCVLTIVTITICCRKFNLLELMCSRIVCPKKKRKTFERGHLVKENRSLPSLPKVDEPFSRPESNRKERKGFSVRKIIQACLRPTRSVPDKVPMLEPTSREAVSDSVRAQTTTLTTETEIDLRPNADVGSSRRSVRRSVSESTAYERQLGVQCVVHADVAPPAHNQVPTMSSACITRNTQEITSNGGSSTNREETWPPEVFLPSTVTPNSGFAEIPISVRIHRNSEGNQQRPGPSITRDEPEWMEQPRYSLRNQNHASFLDRDSGSFSFNAPVLDTRSSRGDGGVGFPSWDEPEDVAPSLFTASYNSGSNLAARIEPLRNRHNYIVSCYNHEHRVRVGVGSEWSEDQLHTFRREIARDSCIDMHLISMYRQSIAVAQNIARI